MLGLAAAFAAMAGPARAEVSAETQYILNSFSFLMTGALVMWMAAGFAMLESGLVRTKNTASICLKNIALYSIAGLMYYLIGYSLMYVDVDGLIGSFSLLYNPAPAELALINAEEATPELVETAVEGGYASMSDWFFQMVFVATAASIVSGTLAERIRAGGAGLGGFYTPTGVGTQVAEGKETRVIDGIAYVLEMPLKADLAIVKAHQGDPLGNLVYRKTARNFNPMMATCGRVTVAEVEEICDLGDLDPEGIHTEGIFVDRIVRTTSEKRIEQRTVSDRPA